MPIAVWLAAIIPGLTGRVLAALGMGVVTFSGFQAALTVAEGLILSNMSGLPVAVAGLAGLAGVGTGLGIVLGAITARVAYLAVSNATKITGIPS